MDISDETQLYLGMPTKSGEPQTELQGVINYICEEAPSQYRAGNEFERLIKQYFCADPF